MKKWRIPVYWNMTGTVETTANTLEEAIDIVNRREIALPAGKYLDGSLQADDGDIEMIRACYNSDQCDDRPDPVVPMRCRSEVTEFCSECESEITLIWNPETDGYRIFCPNCGEKMMLCNMCPMLYKCDWHPSTDGAGHCFMEEKCYKVTVSENRVATVFVKADTPEEAERKASEVCGGIDLKYDEMPIECTCDRDYKGYPYTDEGTVIIK